MHARYKDSSILELSNIDNMRQPYHTFMISVYVQAKPNKLVRLIKLTRVEHNKIFFKH
jgi:hypothetical protein